MALTGNKFKLGLFFSIGILLSSFLIFWLSGGFTRSNNTTYVCYFPWSVQGLLQGSDVMYNGVSVGHVTKIDIAPDGRLVEVIMDIRTDFEMDSTIVATMQLTGITGLRVINLSASHTGVHYHHVNFQIEYPRIAVGEGAIQTVTTTLTRITEIIHEVDFESISDQFEELLENTNAILTSDKIERIEDAILSNSQHLDSLLITYTRLGRNLNRLVVKLESTAPELAASLDTLVMELKELSEPLVRFTDRMDEVLTESSDVLGSLRTLLDILGRDPSELLIRTSGEGVWQ